MLHNWRMIKIGPPFMKLGRAVLYLVAKFEAWDRKNLMIGRSEKVPSVKARKATG
jgi:hypothetical protein